MPEVGQTYVSVRADTREFGKDVQKGVSEGLDGASKAVENFEKQTRSQMQRLSDTINSGARRMSDVGKTLTTRVTLPIVGIGTAMFKAAGDFEASMNKVRAISGATGEQFEAMSEQAQELGRTTRFSASEAADAMSFLAMAGFDATEVIGAMPGVLELAAAANLDIASSADIASNILSGYGLEVSQLSAVNDALVKTLTRTNTDLLQLGEAMKYAGPIARSAGVDFNEAAAAIGLMGNAGIQGSMAGTSLRQAIAALLSPSGTAAETMERLGITATDAAGRLLPLDQIIQQLEPHADNAGAMMEIFGSRAGTGMAALAGEGSEALRELTTELQNSGGIAGEIAGIQMEGLNGAMLELRAAVEGLFISLGESGLLAAFTGVIDKLTGLIGRLAEVNPEILKFVGTVAGIAAVVGPAALIIGKLTTGVLGMIGTLKAAVTAIGGLAASFGTLTVAMGGIGIALAAAVAAYALFNNKNKEAEELMARTVERANQLADAMNSLEGVVPTLTQEFTDLAEENDTFRRAMVDAGLTVDELARQFEQNGVAATDWQYTLARLAAESGATEADIKQMRGEIQEISNAFIYAESVASEMAQILPEVSDETDAATIAAEELAASLVEQADATQDAEDALWDLYDATIAQFTSTIDYERAVWDTVDAVAEYQTALRNGTLANDDLRETQEALLDQILGTADSAVRAAQHLAEMNGAQLGAADGAAIYIGELQRFAQSLDPSSPVRRNLQQLIDVLTRQIPTSVTVTVDADVTPALSALSSLSSSDIYSPWDIGQVFGPGGELNVAAITAGDRIGTDYTGAISSGVSRGSSSVVDAAEVLIEDLDDAASRAAGTFASALEGVLQTAEDAYDQAWGLVEGRRSQEAAAQRVTHAENDLKRAQNEVVSSSERVRSAQRVLDEARANGETSADHLRDAERELEQAQRDLERAQNDVTNATERLEEANYRLLQVSDHLLEQGPDSIANYIAIATAAGLEADEIDNLISSYQQLTTARQQAAAALEFQMEMERAAARMRASEAIDTAVTALQQKVFFDIEQAGPGADTSRAEREAASLVVSAAEAYADAAADRGTSAWNTVFRDSVSYFRSAYPFLTDELAGISSAIGLANGAIVRSATFAQIGEAGPEVVIPLTRPRRAMELLEESGLSSLAQRQGDQVGSLITMNGVTIQDATDADLVAQRVNAAYRARVLVG